MKRILIVNIVILLVITFMGCGKLLTKDSEEFMEGDLPEYVGYDLDLFIKELQQYKNGTTEKVQDDKAILMNNNNFSEIDEITIPNIKSDKYIFLHMEVNKYNFKYYYGPENTGENKKFDYDTGIEVSVSREDNSFLTVLNQLDLTDLDGLAFDTDRNTWHINNEGRCVTVRFPKTEIVDTVDLLYEFFEFKEYSIDSDGAKEIIK